MGGITKETALLSGVSCFFFARWLLNYYFINNLLATIWFAVYLCFCAFDSSLEFLLTKIKHIDTHLSI